MRTEGMEAKVLSALGLCKKAGALICGTPMNCEALGGRKKPFLVLTASDNSLNTAKRLRDKCAFYGVELQELAINGDDLARAVGKSSKLAAVAVTDQNLCRLVQNAIERKRQEQ